MTPPKLLLLICCILFCITSISAQTNSISGTITDTSSGKKLSNAVVSVIRSKDTVLSKFTRTNEQGFFEIKGIPEGSFFLIVSYPGYAEFLDEIEVKGTTIYKKEISIIPKAKLLEEIIVQQKISAIRIKGDTTEYKADSFKVGPNANVQELLKRLPGLQVNSKGEITAQGQKVEKILVDGEEFFSDDPAVVTQNLRADVVDKVQVFDKKSEQAEFTGVDDGQKTKTINLELKDDKKKGYFGKIEAGTDFNKYRNAKIMINAFKKKQKIAAYITNNNTSFEGLNWNEQRNFGSNSNDNMQVMDDGGMMFWNQGDEFSDGKGLPQSTTAGIVYINKWNKDKNSINGSYQFNDQQVTGRNTSFTKTILPDSSFSNNTIEKFTNFRSRNKLNAVYEWQIDSSSSLKVKASGSIVNGNKENSYIGQSISEDNIIINETNRITKSISENRDFTSEISWRKRLNKKGRTISYTGNWSNNNKSGNGFLFSNTGFFDENGLPVRQQDLDQNKTNKERQQIFQNNLVYTEPLSKKLFLELTYRNNFSRSDAERNTFEKPIAGDKYTAMVDTLSNHFLYRADDHSAGFSFRFTEKKYNLSVGTAIGRTNFGLEEITKGNNRNIAFTNLLPKATIRFTPTKQKSFSLAYSGSTQNPTLQQINPILDNIDPINLTIGNPLLKQAFRHNFSVNMNDYKIIKSRNFYLSGNFSFTNNAISSSNKIDSGVRVNQAININGNYNGSVWAMYGFEIAPSINFNFRTNSSTSRLVNVVNGQKNISNNHRIGFGIGIGKWSEKWLSFDFSIEPSYNYSISSLNKSIATKYWTLNSYPYLSMKFKKQKLYFDLTGDINIYQKSTAFQNQQNVIILNTSVKRTFTKTDAFEIKLSVNDIFNQNQGIERNISSNFISENTFQNIRRYALLTLTWNFTKNGKPSNNF